MKYALYYAVKMWRCFLVSVNLQKGQKVDLTKGNAELKWIRIGLGWDEAKKPSALLRKENDEEKSDFDCDASAFLIDESGTISRKEDIVYFGNLRHRSGCVTHQGDNLTGEGDGDDEQIMVNLYDMPQQYQRIVFVVNIYKARERGQHFGQIENAYIRIVDAETNRELCIYNLSENYDGMTALVFGEVYRRNGEWKFNAIGQPTKDNTISEMAHRFGF